MIDQLLQIINEQRCKVPFHNWYNYNQECQSYIDEIIQSPGRFQELTDKLWQRIQFYQSFFRPSLPPLLCRFHNESNEQYINRIYEKGGYHAW